MGEAIDSSKGGTSTGEAIALGGRRVASVMRRDFVTIDALGQLQNAISIMRLARLRHLPVERDGALAGLLSYRLIQDAMIDLLKHGRDPVTGLSDVSIDSMMTEAPFTISPSSTLREAAGRLCALKLGCLPVVETIDGREQLVGLITETDLLLAAYAGP